MTIAISHTLRPAARGLLLLTLGMATAVVSLAAPPATSPLNPELR